MNDKQYKTIPLYRQIYNSIVDEISSGKLKNGDKLPARRKMSEIKKVSPFTIDETYKLLIDSGYAISKPRKGIFVVNGMLEDDYLNPWQTEEKFKYNFSPNGIDTKNISDNRLIKIISETAINDDLAYLGYGEKGGEKLLRKNIADYLYKIKGLDIASDHIIIGGSADYLITSLMRTLPPNTVYAMTDHDKSYYTFNSFERNVTYVPMDINGIKTDILEKVDANILYVIPSCQFPLCSAMTTKQKEAIIKWAYEKEDRYIIEDNYCSDFTCSTSDTLYSMDKRGRVLYIGHFEKTIAPTFKLGYIVLPNKIMDLWNTMHGYYYPIAPIFNQIVLAKYISSGNYSRHIKSINKLYSEKYKIMTESIKAMSIYNHKIKLLPFQCGLHVLITVKSDKTKQELKYLARSHGIKINSLSDWKRLHHSYIDERVFMLGFGDIDKQNITPGIRALDSAWSNI